jgi:glutathione S-transferase
MTQLTLIIGNKNYSSWSLRPWILLQHLQLPFEERVIPLDRDDTAAAIAQYSRAGRVPVLLHDELVLWESIAIGEYVCELAGGGWPRERTARARARVVSAEMHSGFTELRSQWPMNARATQRRTPPSAALLRDVARIDAIWSECRARAPSDGPWLFGAYSLADAMYAPVALRCRTYGATLSVLATAYLETVLKDPILGQWLAAAELEPWVIPKSEVGLSA